MHDFMRLNLSNGADQEFCARHNQAGRLTTRLSGPARFGFEERGVVLLYCRASCNTGPVLQLAKDSV